MEPEHDPVPLHARIRWATVGPVLALVAATALVVLWPRVAPAPPDLPPAAPEAVAVTPSPGDPTADEGAADPPVRTPPAPPDAAARAALDGPRDPGVPDVPTSPVEARGPHAEAEAPAGRSDRTTGRRPRRARRRPRARRPRPAPVIAPAPVAPPATPAPPRVVIPGPAPAPPGEFFP